MQPHGDPRPLDDASFMRAALREAKIASEEGEVPVGAVVVHDGKNIGRAHTQAESWNDPDGHHVVEDIAIVMGRAFGQALGDRKGIVRMSHMVVPLDEALAMVAVDVGGRGYAVVDTPFGVEMVGDLLPDLARHFLETIALEGRINIHAKFLAGVNDHHKIEALFKALARALDAATQLDPRISGQVPSTKGVIES